MKSSLVSSFRRVGCIALIAGAATLASAQSYQYVNWTPNDEAATCVDRTVDGGYIMAGNRRANATSLSAIVLLKLDALGAQQWQRVYSIPNISNTAQCVQKTSDGGYIIAGETGGAAGGNGILLLKVDSLGNFQWSRAYAGSAFSGFGGTVVRQSPNGYVLIGRAFGAVGTQMAAVYLETDPLGNQLCGLYFRRTDYGANSFMSFNDIRVNNDGTNTVVGFVRNGDAAPREPLAAKLRCTSVPVWAKTYGPNTGVAGDWAGEGMDIRYVGNSPVYVMTGPANTTGSFVTTIDTLGNLTGALTKLYPTFLNSQSIRWTSTGDSIISGNVAGGFGLGDAAYMKVNPAGGVTYAYRDGGADVDGYQEAIVTSDGGLFTVGGSRSPFPAGIPPVPAGQQTNFYYAKAAASGRTGCNEAPLQISPQTFDIAVNIPLLGSQMPQPQVLQFNTLQTLTESSVLCLNKSCVPPPPNMTLWLPMDEAGGMIATNIAGGNNGFHSAATIAGAVGMVNNGAAYANATFTRVPTYAGIQPGVGNLSFDAWVFPTASPTTQFFAEKAITSPGYRGYGFAMIGGTNQLVARFGNGGAPVVATSVAVPAGVWSHVAVTVNRNDPAGIKFYLNGALVGSSSSIPINGFNLNSTASFNVAASGAPGSYFTGKIDEVEFFKRVLSATEISNLFTAGASGKCKQWVWVPPMLAFCFPNINTVSGTAQIANYGGPAYSPADYWFNPLSPGTLGSTIWGPTSFAFPAPPAVIPYSTQSVPLTIGRPTGMTAVGITAAYEMWGQYPVAGSVYRNSQGVVKDYRNLCLHVLGGNNGLGSFVAKVGEPFDFMFSITNNSSTPLAARARIRALDTEGNNDLRVLSLNGLPPGVPWEVPPGIIGSGGHTDLAPTIVATMDDPMGFYTIILEADLDGDGEYEPVNSASLRIVTPGQCPADFNNDGAVDFFDYLDFVDALSSQDPSADFNADGAIDFFDYLDFVDALSNGC